MAKALANICPDWCLVSKSAICVSKSVDKVEDAQLVAIVGVKLVDCHELYLGIPSFASRNKKLLFDDIKNRL
ncbi:hypothetical protein Ddye_023608 [Dipteronia dyeriana]|uniref:Uncharacterized protein n=1 Tax=Dipteronia dyeriana TaxID=168575 RepID=A0AAD9TU74_9ROSI|nr:hypothetical protein Ddye_023608 [Dipteronia dyeriana]